MLPLWVSCHSRICSSPLWCCLLRSCVTCRNWHVILCGESCSSSAASLSSDHWSPAQSLQSSFSSTHCSSFPDLWSAVSAQRQLLPMECMSSLKISYVLHCCLCRSAVRTQDSGFSESTDGDKLLFFSRLTLWVSTASLLLLKHFLSLLDSLLERLLHLLSCILQEKQDDSESHWKLLALNHHGWTDESSKNGTDNQWVFCYNHHTWLSYKDQVMNARIIKVEMDLRCRASHDSVLLA